MGLFSFLLGKSNAAPEVIPSLEEQQAAAKLYVDSFLDEVYDGFDKVDEDDFEIAYFRIAGITNYCSWSDIGLIKGVTVPYSNPYDKTAIGLGRVRNGRVSEIYGHIPKADKRAFNKLVGDIKQRPFFGYIKEFVAEDGHKGLMGVIKVYKGNGAKLYRQMVKDVQLLQGLFKGYYGEQTLEEQREKLEWILERKF